MSSITLYKPNIDDYWYEEKIEKDPLTMNYNAGYDVSYKGYHYDTGCIDFSKDQWEEKYQKRKNYQNYYAYIVDQNHQFVGICYYLLQEEKNYYECGIVVEHSYRKKGYAKQALSLLIEEAKRNHIKELYDSFEADREDAIALFQSFGFQVVKREIWKKHHKDVEGILLKKSL